MLSVRPLLSIPGIAYRTLSQQRFGSKVIVICHYRKPAAQAVVLHRSESSQMVAKFCLRKVAQLTKSRPEVEGKKLI